MLPQDLFESTRKLENQIFNAKHLGRFRFLLLAVVVVVALVKCR